MKSPNKLIECGKIIQNLRKFYKPSTIEKIARKCKFIKRKKKIEGITFLTMCIFWTRRTSFQSLDQLCAELSHSGINICKQSLNQRFSPEAVEFIKVVAKDLLNKKINEVRCHLINAGYFNRITVKDSTVFQLPEYYAKKYPGCGGGASEAGIKIQYSYDLLENEDPILEVTDAITPDSVSTFHRVFPRELRVEDLGYFNLDKFKQIRDAGGYYLSRYRFGVKIYQIRQGIYHEVDLSKMISNMKVGEISDREI